MARLRFDRVAQRFVRDVQAALRESAPDGKALIVTVTAPIRLSSKTAAQLVDQIQVRLARHPVRLDVRATINGNRLRIRLVSSGSRRRPNVLGFVNNPDIDADVVLDVAQSMLGSL